MIEPKAGSFVSEHALVLGATRYQETGKIVRVFTALHGKRVLFAPGAVNSRRRFGAALEPLSLVTVFYRQPRMNELGDAPLPVLQKADLENSFLHLRQNSRMLEMGLFGASLVDEFMPEGQEDSLLFRVLGRLLRDSQNVFCAATHAPWGRLAFWNWATRHLGYGDLISSAGSSLPSLPADLQLPWDELMNSREPSFVLFFSSLPRRPLPNLTVDTDALLYSTWTRITGLHWSYFEQWIKQNLLF